MKLGFALAVVLCLAVAASFPRVEANEAEAKILLHEEGEHLSTDATELGAVALKRSSRKLKGTESEETRVAEAEGTELDHDPASGMMRDLKGYFYKYNPKIHVYYFFYNGKKYYFIKPYYYYKDKKYYAAGVYKKDKYGKKYYYYKKYEYKYYIKYYYH